MNSENFTTLPIEPAILDRLSHILHTRPFGLLTDIDGTLSTIAPTPDKAILYPGIKELLIQYLHHCEVVAAITGRVSSDAFRMVGIPGIIYIGNHGLEQLNTRVEPPLATVVPQALSSQKAIEDALNDAEKVLLPQFPGILIEHKGVSGSIHYRLVANPDEAQTAIINFLQPLAEYGKFRIMNGKMVVELRPATDIHKGTAVSSIVSEYNLKAALYLGDDTTDIDAFRQLHTLNDQGKCAGIAISVLHPEAPDILRTESDIPLPSMAYVPSFLQWVLNQIQSRHF
jgi:trehalose 6-phosphate phosphatase